MFWITWPASWFRSNAGKSAENTSLDNFGRFDRERNSTSFYTLVRPRRRIEGYLDNKGIRIRFGDVRSGCNIYN